VIEWKDLSFDVRSEKNKTRSTKAILKSVSGFGAPGELLAIMGSSGAGKTTLLNLISGRTSVKRNQKLLGSIMLNGKEADFKSIRRFSAYVMQEDVFYESLTPRELITASAMLRLPNTVSAEERNNKIESVITELGLEKVADTVVGGPSFGKRGLSGGEKKRVAIAIELVNDPSILFLDEP
jgi:ABC-type multidrug transport system ATPase subunit